ncbi:MAG TPA: porin [Tepidisphaeraceae bacterium]|nr:porin [Tepidisphaeraceae bacterium]
MSTTAVAGALSMAASAALAADPVSSGEMMGQIAALRAEVAQLKGEKAAPASTDATRDGVLRDADGRGALMQADSAFVAGYSKGKFLLQSADGKFVFHPTIQFQVRNATNLRDEGGEDGEWEGDNGWELRRTKLGFDGNAFTKDLTYNFVWATNRNGGGLAIEDAWVRYKFAPAWGFRVGQFKAPVNHESLVSSKRQLAADVSYFNETLFGSSPYSQGISLIYDDGGALRAEVAFTDGYNESNGNFQDPGSGGTDANFGVGGRVEYKVMGEWGAYEDFTALGTKADLLVIGAGADITQTGDTNAYRYVADVQYEVAAGQLGGLGLFGQIGGTTLENGGGTNTNDDDTNWGMSVQAGYMLGDRCEPFARYDYTKFESAPTGFQDDVHELTVGVNYYFVGHNAKVTVDLNYLPNGAPVSAGGLDILQSQEDQIVIRGQFQLLL